MHTGIEVDREKVEQRPRAEVSEVYLSTTATERRYLADFHLQWDPNGEMTEGKPHRFARMVPRYAKSATGAREYALTEVKQSLNI